MKLIRARCCVQSGPWPRAKECSVWPKWSIDILSQNSEHCKQNAIFSGASHQKQVICRWYIDKQVIYCRFPARALQPLSDWWKFQDKFANTAAPKFHSNSVSALCEGWLPCIASVMQGLLTPQNHRCKNRHSHFATISVSLTDSEKCCFKQLSRF